MVLILYLKRLEIHAITENVSNVYDPKIIYTMTSKNFILSLVLNINKGNIVFDEIRETNTNRINSITIDLGVEQFVYTFVSSLFKNYVDSCYFFSK